MHLAGWGRPEAGWGPRRAHAWRRRRVDGCARIYMCVCSAPEQQRVHHALPRDGVAAGLQAKGAAPVEPGDLAQAALVPQRGPGGRPDGRAARAWRRLAPPPQRLTQRACLRRAVHVCCERREGWPLVRRRPRQRGGPAIEVEHGRVRHRVKNRRRPIVAIPLPLARLLDRQPCRQPEAPVVVGQLAAGPRLVARADARQQQHVVRAATRGESRLAAPQPHLAQPVVERRLVPAPPCHLSIGTLHAPLAGPWRDARRPRRHEEQVGGVWVGRAPPLLLQCATVEEGAKAPLIRRLQLHTSRQPQRRPAASDGRGARAVQLVAVAARKRVDVEAWPAAGCCGHSWPELCSRSRSAKKESEQCNAGGKTRNSPTSYSTLVTSRQAGTARMAAEIRCQLHGRLGAGV